MKIVICRACRAPLAEIGERERRQRVVATHRASKNLALAARRAMKRVEAREESGSDAGDDASARAHPLRIAEILRPCRREYDALPEEAQKQFLEVRSGFSPRARDQFRVASDCTGYPGEIRGHLASDGSAGRSGQGERSPICPAARMVRSQRRATPQMAPLSCASSRPSPCQPASR